MTIFVAMPARFVAALTQPATAFAGSLVRAVWEGAVLAICVALCLRLLPRLTAAARSLVWSAVFGLAVLLFFASMMRVGRAGLVAAAGAAKAAGLHLAAGWALALVSIWALCSLVRAVQLGLSALHLRGILRRATPLTTVPKNAKDLMERIAALVRTLEKTEQGRSVQICASTEVDVPCVAGFGKAQILLPADLLASASLPDLEQVLLHEMEHLRRNDHWINLLQKAALVLFPLNPVLLWLERRVCVERELACDDGVMRATSARKAYAICLANLAEHSLMRRGLSLALGAWERQTELARRVQRILSRPAGELGRVQAGAVVGLLLAGALGGGVELSRSPELISFAASSVASSSISQSESPTANVAPNLSASLAAPGLGTASIHSANAVPLAEFHARSAHPTLVRAAMPESVATTKQFVAKSLLANEIAPAQSVPEQGLAVHSVSGHALGSRLAAATVVIARHASHAHVLNNASVRRGGGSSPWIVLTRWQGVPVPAVPGSVAFAVSEDSQFTYAAVPTPDGWLIVQL